ncbi:DUF6884 domain-containing protein [Actinomadura miaoliensis]|uniref:DUF6884 domain-containing protein n=1 Tax=Actinomadura miaoliensis TaxID=430685 RepID=UPI0031E63B97
MRELLVECVSSLPEPFTRQQVIDWFRQNYPDIAERTIVTQVGRLTEPPDKAQHARGLAAQAPLLVRVDRGRYKRISSLSSTARPPAAETAVMGLVLVGCVKTKADRAMAAKDLYRSPLFQRRRTYAERTALPWFILSSRWGLVAPDEVIAPYDMYLGDQPVSYRRAWASFVTQQLLLHGPVAGRRIEIHAGDAYIAPLRPLLEDLGAVVIDPVDARSRGEIIAWYNRFPSGTGPSETAAECGEIDRVVDELAGALSDRTAALTIPELRRSERTRLSSPGVYGWWVDADGAHDLSVGIGERLDAGLIYVGQAGATRRPSGKRSAGTLWSRIVTMHLSENAELSTFRRTLAAALRGPLRLRHEDDSRLSDWMTRHLSVAAVPCDDADDLRTIKEALLRRLDPPLNLNGVPSTPLRARLRALRAERTDGNRRGS